MRTNPTNSYSYYGNTSDESSQYTTYIVAPRLATCLCIGERIYFARQDGKRRHLVLNEAIPAYLWLPSSADFLSLDVQKEINRIMGVINRQEHA